MNRSPHGRLTREFYGNGAAREQARAKFKVIPGGERFVPAARFLYQGSAHGKSRRGIGGMHYMQPQGVGIVVLRAFQPSVAVEAGYLPAYHIGVGTLGKSFSHALHVAGQHHIVGVEKHHILRFHTPQSGIAGYCRSAARFRQQHCGNSVSGIPGNPPGYYLGSDIGGTVVNHYHAEWPKGLGRDGIERGLYHVGAIKHRHHYGGYETAVVH